MIYGKRILLIVGGGVAAFKAIETLRLLRERGAEIRCVLTKAGGEFVTPLSLGALSGQKVHQELFDLTAEAEMRSECCQAKTCRQTGNRSHPRAFGRLRRSSCRRCRCCRGR